MWVVSITLFVLIVLGAVAGAVYSNGKAAQERQSELLLQAYSSFSSDKLADAYALFCEAKGTFSDTLAFYRRFSGSANLITREELGDLLINTCLGLAHDNFFYLRTADEWVKNGEAELASISSAERCQELKALLNTAKGISHLCQMYGEGKFEDALNELASVEDSSLSTDQDFFIFEIRLLIACGKALDEPAVLNQARELLFFATTQAGIDNEKTRNLWGFLAN